jgi:hypothetical protein
MEQESKPASEVTPGVAAIAAKAAAVAQALTAASAKASTASADGRAQASHQPLPPADLTPTSRMDPAASRPPMMFSMGDSDDESGFDLQSPSMALPLETNLLPDEPGLSFDEEREYEEIEARFKRFQTHQSEVERNVTALLDRLNTQIRVPSSVASSECSTSEWDTESLGPTDDGLSILDSPIGSPRESTLLQKAASSALKEGWESSHPELRSAAEKLKPSERLALGVMPSTSPPPSAREKHTPGRLSFGSAGAGVAERGDLGGPRPVASGEGSAELAEAHDSNEAPLQSPSEQPRLTPLLLQQSGLGGADHPAQPEIRARSVSPPPGSPRPAPTRRDTAAPAIAAGAPPAASMAAAASTPVQRAAPAGQVTSPLVSTVSPSPLRLSPLSAGDGAVTEDEEMIRWRGWTVVATPEGRLFFHNEQAQLSQWSQPPELVDVLGEWVEIHDRRMPDTPPFWRNDLLRVSLWKDPRQTTNIFQAALDGNLFFLQLYSEVDGHLDVVDPKGRGALHYACAGGATQSAVFLLQRKAEVNRQDETASTPLIFACRYGYASIVKLLLDAQAGLDHTNDHGNTALHEAASMGNLDCVHLLLICGASANQRNSDGDSPADIAGAKKHYPCLTLLRRHTLNFGPRAADGVASSGASRPPVQAGMAAPSMRQTDSQIGHSSFGERGIIPEVPSGTSESAPFAGTGSSADPVAANAPVMHGMMSGGAGGGFDLASAVAAQMSPAAVNPGAAPAGDSGLPQSAHSSGLRRRGRGPAGRSSQVQYAGQSSDSDGGAASSAESSEDNPSKGNSAHMRRGRRAERPPVALGLLSRKELLPAYVRREHLLWILLALFFIWLLGLKACFILVAIILSFAFFCSSTERGRSLHREISRLVKALEGE